MPTINILRKNLKFHQPAYKCLSFAKEIRNRCMQDKNYFNKVGDGTTEEVLKFISLHHKIHTTWIPNTVKTRFVDVHLCGHVIVMDSFLCPWEKNGLTCSLNSTHLPVIQTTCKYRYSVYVCINEVWQWLEIQVVRLKAQETLICIDFIAALLCCKPA